MIAHILLVTAIVSMIVISGHQTHVATLLCSNQFPHVRSFRSAPTPKQFVGTYLPDSQTNQIPHQNTGLNCADR